MIEEVRKSLTYNLEEVEVDVLFVIPPAFGKLANLGWIQARAWNKGRLSVSLVAGQTDLALAALHVGWVGDSSFQEQDTFIF